MSEEDYKKAMESFATYIKNIAEINEKLAQIIFDNMQHMTFAQITDFYKVTCEYLNVTSDIVQRYSKSFK